MSDEKFDIFIKHTRYLMGELGLPEIKWKIPRPQATLYVESHLKKPPFTLYWDGVVPPEKYQGWTPLHLAALCGKVDLVKSFLENFHDETFTTRKWQVTAEENKSLFVTPLMCAALAGSLECIEDLISRHPQNEEILFQCDQLLLFKCAVLGNNSKCHDLVAYHNAFKLTGTMDEWLSEEVLRRINEDWNKAGLECTTGLLPKSQTSRKPVFSESTLQIFVRALRIRTSDVIKGFWSEQTIRYLVQTKAILPMHILCSTCKKEEDKQVANIIQTLVDSCAQDFWRDNAGAKEHESRQTALNIAVSRKLVNCQEVLMRIVEIHTADLMNLEGQKKGYIKRYFDRQVKTCKEHKDRLYLDLRFMNGWTKDKNRSLNLLYELSKFEDETEESVLLHPVVQTYLLARWEKYKWYFYLGLICQILHLGGYSSYIMVLYNADDGYSTGGMTSAFSNLWIEVGAIVNFMLLSLRFLYSFLKIPIYKNHVESIWGFFHEICLCFAMLFTLVPVNWIVNGEDEIYWAQKIFGAVTVFLVCCTPLWYCEIHPDFGVYIILLRKVFKNFAWFFLVYFWVLLGFSMAFSVLVGGKPPFQDLIASLMEVIRMMVGEIDIKESEHFRRGTCLFYIFFIFTVTMVLISVLNGLAVQDIRDLHEKGMRSQIKNQIRQMNMLEAVLYAKTGVIANCLPERFKTPLKNQIRLSENRIPVGKPKEGTPMLSTEIRKLALKIKKKNRGVHWRCACRDKGGMDDWTKPQLIRGCFRVLQNILSKPWKIFCARRSIRAHSNPFLKPSEDI